MCEDGQGGGFECSCGMLGKATLQKSSQMEHGRLSHIVYDFGPGMGKLGEFRFRSLSHRVTNRVKGLGSKIPLGGPQASFVLGDGTFGISSGANYSGSYFFVCLTLYSH